MPSRHTNKEQPVIMPDIERMTVDDIACELPKTIADWTRHWLVEHSCVGLANDGMPCSCPIDDLFACGAYGADCHADTQGLYGDLMDGTIGD